MTDATAVFSPGFRVLDANGDPVSGAKCKFYDAGTSDPKTVYSDAGLSVALGVVVYCDSGGYPVTTEGGSTKTQIYVGTDGYKLIITDEDDATVATHDNISGAVIGSTATEFAKAQEPVVSVTSSRAIASTDYGKLIQANPTAGSISLTLPDSATAGDGTRIHVRHKGTAGSVSVSSSGSQPIEGPQSTSTTYTLANNGDEVTFICTGAGWVASSFYIKAGSITNDKLSAAISGSFVQAGSMLFWPVSDVDPAGYLDADGSAVSRSTYSELFGVLGEKYGPGDGSTTFNLPDWRGLAPRAWDNGAGVDLGAATRTDRGDGTTGDAVGTKQGSGIPAHTHDVTASGTTEDDSHTHGSGTLATASDGAHTHSYTRYAALQDNVQTGGVQDNFWQNTNSSVATGSDGAHTHSINGSTAETTHNHTVDVTGTAAAQDDPALEVTMANISARVMIFAGASVASGASSSFATLLHGTGTPNDELGANGDYYVNTTTYDLYGPKAADAWPATPQRMVFKWRSSWVTATSYVKQDVVKSSNGNVYTCILAHTSDSADEPGVGTNTATYWELMVEKGSDGATGPSLGQDYAFDDGTADADPGSGKWRLDNATPGSATNIYISKTDRNGGDLTNVIDGWDASTSTTIKGNLKIVDPSDTGEQFDCRITGALTDGSTYWKVPISNGVFNGAGSLFADATVTSILFTAAGDAGAGIANAYYRIKDGTTTAEASGPDEFKIRAGTGISAVVQSNDATHGDNVLISLSDAELEALAGLTSAADKLPYFTGSGTADVADLSAFGRTLIDDADAATARATLGLEIGADVQAYDADVAALAALTTTAYGLSLLEVADEAALKALVNLEIGTDVQAYDAELAAFAGLTSAANKLPYFTGSGTAALADLTSFGRSLIDDATASDARTTLGVSIGSDVQAYDADLAAVSGLGSTGLIARTGAGTAAARTLTSGTGISISNGDGVSGNPTIAADVNGLTDRDGFGSGDKIAIYDVSAGEVRKIDYDDLPGSGGGISNGYANVTDGTTTASASGADTFKLRVGTGLTIAVQSNDATHGDNALVGLGFSILDEDDMSSDSATDVPSQQSVKAYVDAASGSAGTVQTFSSSGTYTKPAGLVWARVTAVGPGGGGGGAITVSAGSSAAGGGGGAGGVAVRVLAAASIGSTETVTIGSGGAGGAATGADGADGSASTTFGSLVEATPGSGGDGNNSNGSNFSARDGGAGGSTSGTISYPGFSTPGQRGLRNGAIAMPGAGGSCSHGNGAASVVLGAYSVVGTGPSATDGYGGGGAGGAASGGGGSGDAGNIGGDGADGYVIVEEFY
jgi:microcystin-dependent protein